METTHRARFCPAVRVSRTIRLHANATKKNCCRRRRHRGNRIQSVKRVFNYVCWTQRSKKKHIQFGHGYFLCSFPVVSVVSTQCSISTNVKTNWKSRRLHRLTNAKVKQTSSSERWNVKLNVFRMTKNATQHWRVPLKMPATNIVNTNCRSLTIATSAVCHFKTNVAACTTPFAQRFVYEFAAAHVAVRSSLFWSQNSDAPLISLWLLEFGFFFLVFAIFTVVFDIRKWFVPLQCGNGTIFLFVCARSSPDLIPQVFARIDISSLFCSPEWLRYLTTMASNVFSPHFQIASCGFSSCAQQIVCTIAH